MVYVVVFLAGALAAASALIIWYFRSVTLLSGEKQNLKNVAERLSDQALSNERRASEMANAKLQLDEAVAAFDSRRIRYEDLHSENDGLKQDLFNLSVQIRKMERDHAAINQRQEHIEQRANEIANRYLEEHVSWIASRLTANNFSSSKQRLLSVIAQCRAIGFDVPPQKEAGLVDDLKNRFEDLVRVQFAREEQARIRAQIREDERMAREVDRQIQDAERETAAIQAALARTLLKVQDEHSAEVEALRAKLKEAEERAQRAKSMAQMTKAGHVYVISNIGSFGEGVFKIGMTRRLEPMDRVRELGDASVPFPFDVHMMISCDDAPSLENSLHRELRRQRMNKINFRKEFFRVDLASISRVVEESHGTVDYVAEPEALEYRESVNMPDDDYEFIEHTVQPLMQSDGSSIGED